MTTVHRVGRETLRADEFSVIYLRFRDDRRMIVDGEICGAPHYTASAGRLRLREPDGTCYFSDVGTPLGFRISGALDQIEAYHEIAYNIDGSRLTLAAGPYRIVFVHAERRHEPGPPRIRRTTTYSPSVMPKAGRSPGR